MSLTLATVADALIEFILSLLRDPDAAAEFEQDPEGTLLARGLNTATASDVASVAPIIIERTQVVQVMARPSSDSGGHSPVVREIKQVVSHVQWVDDRDTIVDQSVNQNIWAEGDVTQTFDNEAIVASGDDAVAAGGDAHIEKILDRSTVIEAGEDVNMGNDTTIEIVEDAFNEATDASQETDGSTVFVVEDSFDDHSDSTDIDDSFTEEVSSTEATQIVTDVQVIADSSEATVAAPEAPSAPEVIEPDVVEEQDAEQPSVVETAYDSAVEYVESAVEDDATLDFGEGDALAGLEGETDDNY